MAVTLDDDPPLELPLDAEEAGDAEEDFSPDDEYDNDEDEDEDADSDGEGSGDGGAGNGCGKSPLKKGPWTPEEDRRLKEYVEAHGEGNWNQVQRNAGLNRCGKSCRLRWANHLRPDLKKGPFDDQEIDCILKFHYKWGNKWAKMASNLPGRTDNEIKNFWNTRLKRHQRALLPIYPEYIRSQDPDEDMNCDTPDESRGRKRSNESSQEKALAMSDLMDDCLYFQHLDYGNDPLVPEKQLKRYASTGNLASIQIPVGSEKTFCSTDFNHTLPKSQSVPLGSAIASGYPIFNGNPSTSGTIHRSMKTELPSFQCPGYGLSNDGVQCPSAPHIEQGIDQFTQSPPSIPLENTGLLGAIVHTSDVLYDPTKSEGLFAMQVPSAYSVVSQSNAYPPRHYSSSVLGDYDLVGCPSTEIQAPNSPSVLEYVDPLGTCFPDMALDASLVDNQLNSLFDEDYCEQPKPFTDAGQWPDSSIWKNMPGCKSE